MPTYVYACDSCGAQFEQFQSFKDQPLRTCPACAGSVRRVFQPVGIVFKGSGWYITDSRKSSTASVGIEDTTSKVEKATTTESTTETKATTNTSSATDTKSSSASTSTPTKE